MTMTFKSAIDAVENVSINVGSKAAPAGGATAAVSDLLHNNLGFWVGVVIGVLGWATSAFFQWRRDRREELLLDRQLDKLKTKPGDLT